MERNNKELETPRTNDEKVDIVGFMLDFDDADDSYSVNYSHDNDEDEGLTADNRCADFPANDEYSGISGIKSEAAIKEEFSEKEQIEGKPLKPLTLLDISGPDSAGNAKCGVSCAIELLKNGKAPDYPIEDIAKHLIEVGSRYTREAVVDIACLGEFLQVTLIFKSSFHPELRMFWNELETYGQMSVEDNNDLPMFKLAVMPEAEYERGYIEFSNPIYFTLMPHEVGNDKCDSIRLLFKQDDVMAWALPEDVTLLEEAAAVDRTYKVLREEKSW